MKRSTTTQTTKIVSPRESTTTTSRTASVPALVSSSSKQQQQQHSTTMKQPPATKPDAGADKDDISSLSLIGSVETFQAGAKEVRPPNRNVTYDPSHKWWEPPLRTWFPEHHREILYCIWLYNVVIVSLTRFTNFCGSPKDVQGAQFCSEDFMLHEDMDLRGFSFGLFLLLSFRANQAYNRFWEGRKAWGGIRKVLDFARLVCAHVKVRNYDDVLDRRRAVYFAAAFAVACKVHLRKERDIRRDLQALGMTTATANTHDSRTTTTNNPHEDPHSHSHFSPPLCHQDIANIQHSQHMPLFCQDVMSQYLAHQAETGKLSDRQLEVINLTCLSVMSDALGTCERIVHTPLPLSYVLLLRFFLIVWFVLFPLHGAEYYGWWAIVLANLVAYAVWGVESMVCEIENPFGHDRNGLDLDTLTRKFYHGIQGICKRAESKERHYLYQRQDVEALSRQRTGRPKNSRTHQRSRPLRTSSGGVTATTVDVAAGGQGTTTTL